MAKEKLTFEDALTNWSSLNKFLVMATEEEANRLLQRERAQFARLQFLLRIYGKYNRLRTQRERTELAGEARR